MLSQLAALQFRPNFQAAGLIHCKYLHRRPAHRRTPFDPHAPKEKVLVPTVAPRVEERRQFPSRRIDTCEVRTFSKIASVASQGKVVDVIEPTMLLGEDMLDVVH